MHAYLSYDYEIDGYTKEVSGRWKGLYEKMGAYELGARSSSYQLNIVFWRNEIE